MQALEFSRIGVVELVDVPEPSPGPDEVVIDVEAVGVCGSDIHGIDGGFLRVPPLVMGHEFGGMLEGRRVAVNPMLSCQACDLCRSGHDQLCANRSIIGIHIPGAFTSRIAVPRSAVVELPQGTSATAAALVEPLAVSLRGWRLAESAPDSRVAIIGAGSIGLGVLAAALRDVAEVTVVDLSAERLAVAERLGATTISASLEGTYDVIVDAVGAEATHRSSVEHLAPLGLAVWIGNASAEPGFDARELVRGEHSVRGSFAYSREDFRDAATLAGSMDTSWVETRPLEAAVESFAELRAGSAPAIKIQFTPEPIAA